ncbi:Crp/Fnr family transcriptional regulator [Pedobacter nyackensis]|uniref:cAMP-binding domain of CRP or a regulatory subunit of cAMP-dependent protein kinases n=1 Tax=Pedobacter nyackensis TaxID=475255 RepID=A0A1W2EY10_9SPHI|nr:Crp/Fnr family transcriptional regulator [Pedobacter nyackensis]SMD14593.1 cAMP-binding domain of CRP or a regulatory subunit of cAMP-dependent protein kinases [Pedobacter nyackensis]
MINWQNFQENFDTIAVPAKTVLLNEGAVAQRIYFIKKGCLRLWFNNDGKDVTFQFFFENQSVASIESFRNHIPSQFSIETLEPCVLLSVTKERFYAILDKSTALRKEMEDYSFDRLLSYQYLFLSRIKDSPQKRYEQLLKEHPEIFQRVPQHYIASYLGITSVSLSRIRNRKV